MGKGDEFNLQVKSGWKFSPGAIAVYRIVNQTDGYLHGLLQASECVWFRVKSLSSLCSQRIHFEGRREREAIPETQTGACGKHRVRLARQLCVQRRSLHKLNPWTKATSSKFCTRACCRQAFAVAQGLLVGKKYFSLQPAMGLVV